MRGQKKYSDPYDQIMFKEWIEGVLAASIFDMDDHSENLSVCSSVTRGGGLHYHTVTAKNL